MRKHKPHKKPKKFQLLLDAAFAKPSTYRKLSKKANVNHIRHSYNLSPQTEDKEIYHLATKEERVVVTQDNDFKIWVKPKQAGVFIIPPYLSTKQIDDLLTNFITGKNPDNFVGKIEKIS